MVTTKMLSPGVCAIKLLAPLFTCLEPFFTWQQKNGCYKKIGPFFTSLETFSTKKKLRVNGLSLNTLLRIFITMQVLKQTKIQRQTKRQNLCFCFLFVLEFLCHKFCRLSNMLKKIIKQFKLVLYR